MTPRRAFTLGLAIAAAWPSYAAAASSPQLKVHLGEGARLGARTSVSLDLHVDSNLAAVTEFRLLTPAGLLLSSSRLGVTSCQRSGTDIARVIGPITPQSCPANALMATGPATNDLRLGGDQTIHGEGLIKMYAGPSVGDKPGLIVIVDSYNPARLRLTYAGYLYVPPSPFGVGLAILLPPIPQPPFGIPVSLSNLQLVIGGSAITYHRTVRGKRVAYHPGGIPLPDTCPREGFRFRVILRFADATRRSVNASAPCPPPRRRHR
jgi:hypothetical protein